MELKFLGTSAATPTINRNVPAVALRLDNGEMILFDAGEDVQRRFESSFRMNVPTTICITHMHGDHILGLPGLLFNFHLGERTAPLTIIGPRGLFDFLIMHHLLTGLKIEWPLTLIEVFPPSQTIKAGNGSENSKSEELENKKKADTNTLISSEIQNLSIQMRICQEYLEMSSQFKEMTASDGIILDTKTYKIRTIWVKHSAPTMAFRFEEMEHDGKFNPDRARELKIPEGRLWGKMQKGEKITLRDKRIIDPIAEGIVGPKRSGVQLVYTGDTTFIPHLVEFTQNADILICESTYSEEDEHLAIEKLHMSTRMAAELAKQAHVSQLYLTHFSSRYNDLKILEQQAQKVFPNSIAATDLLEVVIKVKQ